MAWRRYGVAVVWRGGGGGGGGGMAWRWYGMAVVAVVWRGGRDGVAVVFVVMVDLDINPEIPVVPKCLDSEVRRVFDSEDL